MTSQWNFVAAALLTLTPFQSAARGADSLLMTCAVHGNPNMTLKFVREAGAPRDIEVIGMGSPTLWTVRVGRTTLSLPTQTLGSPGLVPVHVGDQVTFRVQSLQHGVLFLSEELARDFLDFDEPAGKSLDTRPPKGEFDWGTERFGANNVLAVATVREEASPPDRGRGRNIPAVLRRLDMSNAMVVPACAGGTFLIAPCREAPARIVSIPLVSLESPSNGRSEAETTITGVIDDQGTRWVEPEDVVEVGKELRWVVGNGLHGVMIKKWNEIKDVVEILEVHGDRKEFELTGANSIASNQSGITLLHLRLKGMPKTARIDYNCTIHGDDMQGVVNIIATNDGNKPQKDDTAALKKLESDWAAAVATNDPTKIEVFFADDFLFVGASGVLQDRAQHLEDFASGKLTITSVVPGELTIHVYGDNQTAVVCSTVEVEGFFGDRDIGGSYQFTDTLIKFGGRWLAAARQQTPRR